MAKNGPDGLPSIHTHWLNSLPFKFSVIQFCIAGLIIASSTWLILSIEKKHHQETQLSLSQNVGLTLVAQLQQTTSKIESLAASMGSMGLSYTESSKQLEQIIPALLNTKGQQSLIASGGIWPEPEAFNSTKKRDSYFWARDENNQFKQIEGYNNPDGAGYHSELWYKPVQFYPLGTTYWSDAYIDPYTNETLITASVPMWLDHKFIGVSTVDLALSSIKSFFNQLDRHQGYILALDSNNHLLAHPPEFEPHSAQTQPVYLSQPFNQFTQAYPEYHVLLDEVQRIDQLFIKKNNRNAAEGSPLRSVLNTIPPMKRAKIAAIIEANVQGSSAVPVRSSSFVLDNDPLFNEPTLVSIFHMPRTYWKIVLVTPLSEIGNKEHAIALKIGVFLLLTQLIALIVLFMFQHKLFVKPISSMVLSLQRGNIAKLELYANQRHDEIGKLAKAFISRSQQLEIAYASLDAGNLALEHQLEMQRHSQKQLKANKDQLNDLLNSSQNLICIKNTQGIYTLVNDKFCEVVGLERRHVIGSKDSDIFPTHIASIIADQDNIVISNESPQSFEQPIPTNQGEITYQITKYPIHDQEGQIIALGAMAFDIHHLKIITEKLLQRTDELNNQLLHEEILAKQLYMKLSDLEKSTISLKVHDEQLRQLITWDAQAQKLMPQLIAQLLKQQLREHEIIFTQLRGQTALSQEHVHNELTLQTASHIDQLRHLLHLVVPQSAEIKSVPIKQFLEHLLAIIAPGLKSHGIVHQLDCAVNMTMSISPWTLLLLFHKLLTNTIEHAFSHTSSLNKRQDDRKIVIRAYKTNQALTFSIRDNGVGLSQPQLDDINNAIDENKGGTLAEINLWLSVTFNGEISIQSEIAKFTEITCILRRTEQT